MLAGTAVVGRCFQGGLQVARCLQQQTLHMKLPCRNIVLNMALKPTWNIRCN